MQMISREKLLKLVSKPDGIVESENVGQAFSYKDFLKESHKKLVEAKREDEYEKESLAYMALRDGWIKAHCPPIEYLGEGSSRLALAIDGGKCLKVAMNDEGIEQNENEIAVLEAGEGYACFPKLYAYDKKMKYSLVVDCCCEAKPNDFWKIYGLACNLVVGTIWQLVNDGLDISKTRSYFLRCIEDPKLGAEDVWENFEKRLAFLSKLEELKDSDMKWESMWALASFCAAHPTLLSLEDLESEVNWGMAGRNGGLCPVVIDAGIA